MKFRESAPTPLRTTCCQHSQTEMRRLSNCFKSFQMKQWLIWCLWLIVLPLPCFSLTRCQDLSQIAHRTLLFCPSSFSWKPSHPRSIHLSDSGWDAGAPCRCSAGPDHRLSNVKPSPLLVHGHTWLENALKLCPNTKGFRCLWCLKFSLAFKCDWWVVMGNNICLDCFSLKILKTLLSHHLKSELSEEKVQSRWCYFMGVLCFLCGKILWGQCHIYL